MKISLAWLNEYLTYDNLSMDFLADVLTSIGLEVESIDQHESIKGGLEKFYIGEVVSCIKHPNADKLSLTEVNLGPELGTRKIVCGAPNVATGQKVVVATEGAIVYLKNDESFTIKNSKIRGEESCGMICAEDELGIGDSHDGILVLDGHVEIGIPAAIHFQLTSDTVFEIGLTPNRTDAMCHRGVARDIAAALLARDIACQFYPNGKTIFEANTNLSTANFSIKINTDLVPKFGGLVIDNIENQPSPEWMRKRLMAIGESPKNLLVDTTNYILHDLGQPLHAYDLSKIDSSEISVSTIDTSQSMIALNGTELKLNSGDVVIRDKSKIIGLAGIMGSQNSCVDMDTKSIFLEGAYFDAKSIRLSSQRLNLRTEAAVKFEKGLDPNGTEFAIEKAKSIILSLCPLAAASDLRMESRDKFDFWKTILTRKKLDLYANDIISNDKVNSILISLGIEIISSNNDEWSLSVPRFKDDVQREEDVIEEILRINGYNNIPYPKFLKSNLSFSNGMSMTQFESKVSSLMIGSGCQEIMTNSISQSRYFEENGPIKLLNSMTSELDCMRSSLIPSFLEVIAYNTNRDQKDLALFEVGNEYFIKNEKYSQRKRLVIAIAGLKNTQNWQQPKGASNDYFQLKAIVEKLALSFNISISYQETANSIFNYGLDIICNQKNIGSFGEVKVNAKLYDLKSKVFAADIDMDYLYGLILKSKVKYTEVVKFPSVKRDLALLIDEQISFGQIETVCKKTLGLSLTDVSLFDIFKDKSLGESKKSYAIRLSIQNKEKTMSDKEIEGMIQKVILNLNKEIRAEIRS
jgi:phenylalanyl-tRNA synthetase beta chain